MKITKNLVGAITVVPTIPQNYLGHLYLPSVAYIASDLDHQLNYAMTDHCR